MTHTTLEEAAEAQAAIKRQSIPKLSVRRFGHLYRGQYADARAFVAWRLREKWRECGLPMQPSLQAIAKAVGLASHSAVIDAVRRINKANAGVQQ